MAKSNKYELDWSKLPEPYQDNWGYWHMGEWSFDLEEEADLEMCEEAIYAHLAWYLFVKERQSGRAEA